MNQKIMNNKKELLKPEEEILLFQRKESGDQGAINIIIESNIGLVINIARKYILMGTKTEDLIQVGMEALMRAIWEFNYKKGNRFSTFAVHKICGSIRDFLSEDRTIRIPHTSFRRRNQLNKEDKTFYYWSMEEKIQKNDEQALINRVIDQSAQEISKIECGMDIKQCLEILSKKEKEIIEMLYGIINKIPMTTRQISKKINIPQRTVSWVHNQALKKMKNFVAQDVNLELEG